MLNTRKVLQCRASGFVLVRDLIIAAWLLAAR
jgi:hypothetical protein